MGYKRKVIKEVRRQAQGSGRYSINLLSLVAFLLFLGAFAGTLDQVGKITDCTINVSICHSYKGDDQDLTWQLEGEVESGKHDCSKDPPARM